VGIGISVLQRKKPEGDIQIHRKGFITRDRLTWLRRLRSSSLAVSKPEAQGSEWCGSGPGPRVWALSPSLSPNAWEPSMSQGRKRWMFQMEQRGRIRPYPPFVLFRPSWIKRCPPTLGRAILLSSPVQMLISSRNTFTDTSENNALPAIRASHSFSQGDTYMKLAIPGNNGKKFQVSQSCQSKKFSQSECFVSWSDLGKRPR